jgi:DNA-binding transcriptional LysR family regulator
MHSYRLQVFHAVARYRSYSRAAREALHISQPAVSKHVQALEAELGVPLVQRVGKRVDLTDAGRLVQQYADQVLALAEETQRALLDLQGLQRGTHSAWLRVARRASICFPRCWRPLPRPSRGSPWRWRLPIVAGWSPVC